jgi:hypothetical protein
VGIFIEALPFTHSVLKLLFYRNNILVSVLLVLNYAISAEKLLGMIFACLNVAVVKLNIASLAAAFYLVRGSPII